MKPDIKKGIKRNLKTYPKLWLLAKSTRRFYQRALNQPMNESIYLYYEKLNTCFISIPKNANSTINKALFVKLKINYKNLHEEKRRFAISQKDFLNLDDDVFVFAFARNPYRRLVSCYKHKILQGEGLLEDDYFGAFSQDMTFPEFVNTVCKIPNRFAEIHFKSQTSFLYPKGINKIDFLGRLENFNRDFQKVKHKLELADKIHKTNVTTNGLVDIEKWYDKKTKRSARKKYRNDFQKLHYDE